MLSSLHFPLLFIIFLLVFVKLCAGSCSQRCGHVHVRFPFQFKDSNPDHSGYPDSRFHISCTEKHEAVIEFPTVPAPVKFFVKHIDYQSQEIQVYDPENCLSRQFLKLNDSSISPFQFKSSTLVNISFFHCSTMLSCPVLAIPSNSGIDETEIVSCTKMRDMSVRWMPWELPFSSIDSLNWNNYMILGWLKPDCSMCEAEGKKCRLKNNSTEHEIECFTCQNKIPISTILIASGGSVGLSSEISGSYQLRALFPAST
ncbi:hypothetical protein L6164_030346 [Bauhinia variegata]|uniref:Uncharacterized protein n=1 Tax=Bauhinia variegata TaxID=167791 RepID=A0ACB9LBV4_BAUVA|nr:hypothetical protein L6164_030346 [Bauhinia variegata]